MTKKWNERADSSLGDDVGPDGSSKAERLFTMLRGTWTKPSKKQTEKATEDREIDNNGDELLAEKKKTLRKTEENGQQNPARREN